MNTPSNIISPHCVILQRQMMQNVELIAFSFPADTCEFMVHFSFKMTLFPCSGANYLSLQLAMLN